MEIQKKITLQFTGIVAILFMLSLIVIYLLFASYRKDDFKERLKNKALSIAQLIAETDKLEPKLLQRIERNNPTSLRDEKIFVFSDKNEIIYTSGISNDNYVSDEFITQIRNYGFVYRTEGLIELIGQYYQGSTKNVIVICYAQDYFGRKKLYSLRIILSMVFILSIFLILFLGRVFAKNALKPISEIIQLVNNIDSNNLQQRVKAGTGKDEISLLAGTFNEMLQRLETAFKAQKDFIANASHELRTPLTSITGSIEVTLIKERTNEEYKQSLCSTLEEVKSLNRLTNRLLTLLRTGTAISDSSFTEIRIDDILWKARSEYLKSHKKHIVEISFDDTIQGENSFTLPGNHDLLKTAFINLIDNGCKYSDNNKINIQLTVKGVYLHIIFKDKGIGIPENEIAHITQPFYRASNVKNRKGHGIGLSLVERTIALHNGDFQITSLINKGTSITLSFPLVKEFV